MRNSTPKAVDKKKKNYPVSTVCRNCGTQQISRYCHNCGQDLFSGSERSLKEITGNFLNTVLALDSKLFVTLRYLMFYPGKLTKEFFAGRIASYVFPAKLFWFMSILFFATLSLPLDTEPELNQNDVNRIIDAVQDNLSGETMKVTDKDSVSQQIKEITDHRMKDKQTSQQFMRYAPYAMFLLIPFFALLIQMFYFRKCRYYTSQMIFSLHFHSFIFLVLTVFNLINFFYPSLFEINDDDFLIEAIIAVVYFTISLYVVYRPKKRHLLWKVPLITLFYSIALLFVIVLLAIIVGIITYGFEIFNEMFD